MMVSLLGAYISMSDQAGQASAPYGKLGAVVSNADLRPKEMAESEAAICIRRAPVVEQS